MEKEQITINKDLYITMKCLIAALMDKYCPNKKFILTKEHRFDLMCQMNINVCAKTLDNLDDLYWIE